MSKGISPTDRVTTSGGYAASTVFQTPATEPTRTEALAALQGSNSVVYAMRVPDGAIKIGCTTNLANRASSLHGEILGFRPGTFADELAIHHSLIPHRARGREYYRPTDQVMAVVNDIRSHFNMPHIAA